MMDHLCELCTNQCVNEDLEKSLGSFVSKYEQMIPLDMTPFSSEKNSKVIDFLLECLHENSFKSQNGFENALASLKTLTRTRHGIESLYKSENLDLLLNIAVEHSENANICTQALKVIVNTVVVHQKEALQSLDMIDCHSRCVALYKGTEDVTILFPVCRIMFYLCLNQSSVSRFIEEFDLFTPLFEGVMRESGAGFEQDQNRCRFISESFKVLFMLNSGKPFEGNKESIISRFGEIIKLGLDEETKTNRNLPTPLPAGLYSVKIDLVNLMWTEQKVPPVSFLKDPEILAGFMELLEVQARTKRESPESALSALLFVLKGVCSNATARKFIKEYIFRQFAWPDPDEPNDPENMKPVGSDSLGPDSISSILIKHLTSFHMTLKTAVGEFLYRLSDEDSSEYIRLVGFGSAVGLLAEKGLPGFGHMKEQALDLDALLDSKKPE